MFTFHFTRRQRWGSKIWPQTYTHLIKHTSRSIILTKCYKHIKQKAQIYTWTKGWRRGFGGKQILPLKTLELNWISIDTFLQIISLYRLIAIITYGVYNFNTQEGKGGVQKFAHEIVRSPYPQLHVINHKL